MLENIRSKEAAGSRQQAAGSRQRRVSQEGQGFKAASEWSYESVRVTRNHEEDSFIFYCTVGGGIGKGK